jgi:hypothetical protein
MKNDENMKNLKLTNLKFENRKTNKSHFQVLVICKYICIILFLIHIQCINCINSFPSFDLKKYEANPIKEGIYTKIKASGPIKLNSDDIRFQDKEEIKKLAEIENYFPKRRRKTQDGRYCAKAFVSEQKTYFDCTKAKTPDGEITDNEWCYVDEIYTEFRNWGYCVPIMDYDRIRNAHYGTMKELVKIVNNLNTDVGQNLSPAQKSMEEIKKVKQLQTRVLKRLNHLTIKLDKVYQNLSNLEKVKGECMEQERKVKELNFQLDAKQRELQEREMQEDKDFSLALKTTNCKGMLLYEHNDEGDGLIGYYYDNENWLGEPKIQKSSEINFDWTDGEPMKGINPYNFSIRWEGWLTIPITDVFTFSIECDDGAELYLNGDLYITHKTQSLVESYSNLINSKQSTSNSTKNGDDSVNTVNIKSIIKSYSPDSNLIGNTKMKIVLKYFHSSHTSVFTKGQVFIRLLWQSKDFQETLIKKKYLLSSFNFSPLKITEYDVEESQLRRLHEDDTAFINSDRYIIQDIPVEFVGSPVLKFKSRYMKDYLVVKTNEPTSIYIALLAHYPFPLSMYYENTGMSMSLLQLDRNQSKGSKKLIAKKSSRLVIYKRSFNKGRIQVKFNKFGLNTKGIPMIVFFGFDTSKKSPLICTGKEEIISLSTGRHFESCTASSDIQGYKCEDGFSGKMRDEEGGMWAANSDGIGAWIEVKFKSVFKITKIQVKNRVNPTERNRKLEVDFSSGEKRWINLKNNEKVVNHVIESMRAKGIRFTIRSVYGTNNNGGGFNVWGVECHQENETDEDDLDASQIKSVDSKENKNALNHFDTLPTLEEEKVIDPSTLPPLFSKDIVKPIFLSCFDSITNSSKFDKITLKPNKKIQIKCPESCALTEIPIYGHLVYSKDSALCKAAFHAKKIPATGGLVKLIILQGTTNYKGEMSNGIKSEGKLRSPLSLSFEIYEEEDNILLKPGTKVDYKSENSNKEVKWFGAIITKVLDTNNGKFLNLILDGENSNSIELPYPNKERIHPCGQHLHRRDCKGSLKRLKTKVPILIRFVPADYQTNISERGYLSDNGQLFGMNNKSYGWSLKMEKRIFTRSNTSHPYLETVLTFPPSINSKYCTKSRPDQMCEPVTWKVKAGKGKFLVKFFIGDAAEDRKIDLKINGKFFAKNKFVPKNTLEVIEEVVETKNEILELSSDCIEDCDNSISVINAIEIFPPEENDDSLTSNEMKEKIVCGNSVEGGRCNKGTNVLHCIYDDPTTPSAKFCNGESALVSIPRDFKCRDQFGKYKCVSKIYSDSSECKLNCPKECEESKCIY